MNRHARRGAVVKNKRLAASISDAADKLQPFVAQIDELQAQLVSAADLVAQTRLENAALMSALNTQQAVYYRLFAQGMGVSLDTVLSMAEAIQTQLKEGKTDGIENIGTASEADHDPGS